MVFIDIRNVIDQRNKDNYNLNNLACLRLLHVEIQKILKKKKKKREMKENLRFFYYEFPLK